MPKPKNSGHDPVDPMDSLFGDLQGVEESVEISFDEEPLELKEDDSGLQDISGLVEETLSLEWDAPPLEGAPAPEDQPTVVIDTTLLESALSLEAEPEVEETVPVSSPSPLPVAAEETPPPYEVAYSTAEPEPPAPAVAVEAVAVQPSPPQPVTQAAVSGADFEAVDDSLISRALQEVRRRKATHLEEEEEEAATTAAPPRFQPLPTPTQEAPPAAIPVPPAHQEETTGMASFTGLSTFDLQNKTPHNPFDVELLNLSQLPPREKEPEIETPAAPQSDEEEDNDYFFTLGFEAPEAGEAELVALVVESDNPQETASTETMAESEEGVAAEALMVDTGDEETIEGAEGEPQEEPFVLGTEEEPVPETDVPGEEESPAAETADVAVTRVNALGGVSAAPMMAMDEDTPTAQDLPPILDTLPLPLDWETWDRLETAARFVMRHRSPLLRRRVSAHTLANMAVSLLLHLDLQQTGVRSEEELLQRLLAQLANPAAE